MAYGTFNVHHFTNQKEQSQQKRPLPQYSSSFERSGNEDAVKYYFFSKHSPIHNSSQPIYLKNMFHFYSKDLVFETYPPYPNQNF